MLSAGILGLPNAGKSTLFNALTDLDVSAESYPFCTIDPNFAIVPIPDKYIPQLAEIFPCDKITYPTIQFIDVAGLIEGAHKGEGMGNQFLANLKGCDALVHTIRLFQIVDTPQKISPIQDLKIIENELKESDLQIAKSNLDKLEKKIRVGDKDSVKYAKALKAFIQDLENDSQDMPEELDKYIKQYQFLTRKPIIYLANIDESAYADLKKGLASPTVSNYNRLKTYVTSRGKCILPLAAKLECELKELSTDERKEYRLMIGLDQSSLNLFIGILYSLLGVITFYTFVGGKELRGWTLKRGTSLHSAAELIHSDIASGFVKAEVMDVSSLISMGYENARKQGKIRIEGREYIVQDGDVVTIKFR